MKKEVKDALHVHSDFTGRMMGPGDMPDRIVYAYHGETRTVQGRIVSRDPEPVTGDMRRFIVVQRPDGHWPLDMGALLSVACSAPRPPADPGTP